MQVNKHNNKLSFQNLGLHIESFFKPYDLLPLDLSEILYKGPFEIEIPQFIIEAELFYNNSKLFEKSKFKNEDWQNKLNDEQEDVYHEVNDNLVGYALLLNSAWETINYDEHIAYDCGLLPFKLTGYNIDKELLGLWGCGMSLIYKLEAYQILVSGTCDERSYFATEGIAYFEKYYGSSSLVVKEIKKILMNKAA